MKIGIPRERHPKERRVADESSNSMNVERRKELVWEMQKIIMCDIRYFPLYNPKLVEAVREDKFIGWVDWGIL